MIARTGLLLGSLLLSLLLLEGGLRLSLHASLASPRPSSGLSEAHPTRGWALVPGASGLRSDIDYRVAVRISSQGLRDIEHRAAKPADVKRIVVLGDSFMEAYQVELEDSLPRRLEELLAEEHVEVINLGVGGYGSTQEMLALEELGLSFAPDLVILAFYADNDVRNNSNFLERSLWREAHLKTFGRPYASTESGELRVAAPDYARAKQWVAAMRAQDEALGWPDTLVSFQLVRSGLARIAQWLGTEVFAYDPNLVLGVYALRFDPESSPARLSDAEYREAWESAWQITQAVILRTKEVAEAGGARFVLLSIPSRFQADASYRERVTSRFPEMQLDPRLPGERLRRFASLNEVLLYDLREPLAGRDRDGHPTLYYQRDRHWNAAGHDFAARQLAAFLRRRGALDTPAEPTPGSP